ncbi:MAG: zf-HC2 domain-containing protein [Planctomycetes bacterium]|nr:zf-HC2 domain-containing protein [Planctomycetota bacterium]
MSACAAVHPLLPAFVTGELAASERAQVREHLHQCCRCRGEAGLLQRAQAALGELGAAAADPRHEAMFADLHRAIVASTVAAGPVQPAGATGPRAAGPSARVVGVAAAVLLLSVGFLIGAGSRDATGRPSQTVPSRPAVATVSEPEAILVVPYAGPRVELRPLGFDRAAAEIRDLFARTDSAGASGLLARRRLRTLVEEGAPIPPVEAPRPSPVGTSTTPR